MVSAFYQSPIPGSFFKDRDSYSSGCHLAKAGTLPPRLQGLQHSTHYLVSPYPFQISALLLAVLTHFLVLMSELKTFYKLNKRTLGRATKFAEGRAEGVSHSDTLVGLREGQSQRQA